MDCVKRVNISNFKVLIPDICCFMAPLDNNLIIMAKLGIVFHGLKLVYCLLIILVIHCSFAAKFWDAHVQ